MVYLFESELAKNKSLSFALCSIYGLGKAHTFSICKNLGFSKNLTVQFLSKEQLRQLIKYIESLDVLIAGDLLKVRSLIAKTLVSIKSYRGLRRYQGLPVRGQRTHGPKFVENARFKNIRQTTYIKNAVKGTAIICSSVGQCTKTRLNAISFPTAVNIVYSYRRLSVGIYFLQL